MEPRRAEKTEKKVSERCPEEKQKRFRIVKLEERIAPAYRPVCTANCLLSGGCPQ